MKDRKQVTKMCFFNDKIAIVEPMSEPDIQERPDTSPDAKSVLAQLELIAQDENFASSKRSLAFLRYVVKETLNGAADLIKERTIGVEVFGRSSTYDTNNDHVVRTAATELRKRLTIYYGDAKHRHELRIGMMPGSYIPRFSLPSAPQDEKSDTESLKSVPQETTSASEAIAELPQPRKQSRKLLVLLLVMVSAVAIATVYLWSRPSNAEYSFWKPLLETPDPVLLAVGYVPDGPPTSLTDSSNGGGSNEDSALAVIQHEGASQTVPYADALTMARVVGILQSHGKKVVIRPGNSSSFSDLRQGPVVLVGAFNNEWSLRLTRQLRYTLALDSKENLIYIKDAKNSAARAWSWGTNQPRDQIGRAGMPPLRDYALITRIHSPETGHAMVVIGGLYTYGTEAAGEFLSDPELMKLATQSIPKGKGDKSLQIVIGTTVTDGTPGPPQVLAVDAE